MPLLPTICRRILRSFRLAILVALVPWVALSTTPVRTQEAPRAAAAAAGFASIAEQSRQYSHDKLEGKNRERYKRVPVIGPITYGDVPVAHAPPSPSEVLRALKKTDSEEGDVPLLHKRSPSNVRITIERFAEYVDPPRVYPLIGLAQQHHAHYKCTIYSTDTTRAAEGPRQVVYVDHNHLHIVGRAPESDRHRKPMPSKP
jgi:hypothetical protein